MTMTETHFNLVAYGFSNALVRIDQSDKDQAAAWLGAVDAVAAELRSHFELFDRDRFEDTCGVPDLIRFRARLLMPLKSNHHCRRCRRHLEDEWSYARNERERAELQRQMDAGRCDTCAAGEAREQLVERAGSRNPHLAASGPLGVPRTHYVGDSCNPPHPPVPPDADDTP